MRNSKIASFGLAVFVTLSGCASGPSIEEQKGLHEAKVAAEVDKLLAPAGLARIIQGKKMCEAMQKKPCGLYGGFAPMEDIHLPGEAPVKPRGPAI